MKNAERLSMIAGRGVDLNRNWSVDWGKKEKVFWQFHLISYAWFKSMDLNSMMPILLSEDFLAVLLLLKFCVVVLPEYTSAWNAVLVMFRHCTFHPIPC